MHRAGRRPYRPLPPCSKGKWGAHATFNTPDGRFCRFRSTFAADMDNRQCRTAPPQKGKRMKKALVPDGGIPRGTLLVMAVTGGLTVANLYYNQPLLETMRHSLGATELEANLITFITQLGYALGLVFIVPLADKEPRRTIVSLNMSVAVVCCLVIALSRDIWTVWGASVVLGCNSVVPQMFIPVASHFSKPANKSRNMGIVLTGLLSGVLGARVVSGYVGEWAGWRTMFAVAAVMAVCLAVILRTLPAMASSFEGSYGRLMRSVVQIYCRYPSIRIYALRGGLSFGSMMAIWSCMAFHLAGDPFRAGSDAVGLLGLCGLCGAVAASGIGKYIPRFGIERFCLAGTALQLAAWAVALCLSDTYAGLVAAIILVDVGAQCHQLSNQSGCLALVPEATNRCNTVFMSHLFAGGSLGTLSAGVAWNAMGWTGVCLVGTAFAVVGLAVSLLFRARLNRPAR